MSGISFGSPALEQPQVVGKGRGRDWPCFPHPFAAGELWGNLRIVSKAAGVEARLCLTGEIQI